MTNLLLTGTDVSGFCTQASSVLGFVGWVLTFFKIAIPLVIIAYGMFDLGKAVVASKDDEIKTQTKRLMYRALAGVFIFFIPSLVMWLFGALGGVYNNAIDAAESEAGFSTCRDCILSPWNCPESTIE